VVCGEQIKPKRDEIQRLHVMLDSDLGASITLDSGLIELHSHPTGYAFTGFEEYMQVFVGGFDTMDVLPLAGFSSFNGMDVTAVLSFDSSRKSKFSSNNPTEKKTLIKSLSVWVIS
jgi:hypothetical protein